jgi:predicted neuraminidase
MKLKNKIMKRASLIFRVISRMTIVLIVISFTTLYGYSQTGGTLKVLTRETVYEKAPFPSCHASTVVETASGLVVAFFGGTAEKNPDVGIWVCRKEKDKWSSPVEAANGIQGDGNRLPCWNPVLYQVKDGDLLLFYKVGPSPSEWWGMLKRSGDGGRTWSEATKLPEGFMGPVKNKPVLLSDGTLLCPSSTEKGGWYIQMERTDISCKTWEKSAPVRSDRKFAAIQPSVLFHNDGKLQLLCRTREGIIAESWSSDNGRTWSGLAATNLPNPNSGTDAVTLADGRQLLVYNPTTTGENGRGGPRTPLSVTVSADGKEWKEILKLETEPGEYSYPAVIQSSDGLIHITYTWKRKLITHVVLKID